MKKTTRLFAATGFLTGVLAGVAIFALFAFTGNPHVPAPAAGITPVSATEANASFRNYMRSASPLNQVVKGFAIDRAQLEAMNTILQENPSVSGFRVYMGRDDMGMKKTIVVGVDNRGNDAVGSAIYSTEALIAGHCPPLCDSNSPITREGE